MTRPSKPLPPLGKVLTLSVMSLGMALSACVKMPMRAVQALPSNPAPETAALAVTKDNLDALSTGKQPSMASMAAQKALGQAVPEPVQITGVGYSQIGAQPGKTLNERRLMAMRAARMEAMRDLTEQVHGLQLTSDTTLRDNVIRSDNLRGVVAGEIRGAKTLRIVPKGNDSYQVILALDPSTVAYILRAARGQV
ncbi:LPP20 family lipoprotein [Thalassovita mediterranea]|uniref:LPP20 lipoprotein n=1 Tax=Thalassovita mediterranea TaxID=340021 RepID=A0A0P1H251_9RHOB|nr:LPP20 family lipoprotein [Thalassovita mediterranea]MCG7572144.1 LPP20 family lipoprotein [Phaeobacter sp. CNT1-3]CUH83400.1 hypothetical protein TM5383_00588 [Thalassovita mediterranea]SIS34141.1 hypothetical protein SAMN05421685_109141 [Thalassovita mediterranea]